MVEDQPRPQVEVQPAHVDHADARSSDVPDWRIPYRRMDGHNLSLAIGLPGTLATVLATIWSIFTIAHGDPGLGWLVLLSVWTAYVVFMGMVWFATADEAG